MYQENFKNITNIDISKVVIEQMKQNYSEKFQDMSCKYN
jgi:hypothetical protein